MRRYNAPLDDQSAFEPGSDEGVLRNKMGIVKADAIALIEAELLRDVQLKYWRNGEVCG